MEYRRVSRLFDEVECFSARTFAAALAFGILAASFW